MTDDASAASVSAQVAVMRDQAGVLARPEILSLRVRGEDRVRFLNGMLSNDVSRLHPGQAQMAVKASAKGRVEGVVRVRCETDALYIDLRETSAERVATELVKFVVMDDVELSDASSERVVLSIHGPEARAVLIRAGFEQVPDKNLEFQETSGGIVIRDDGLGLEGYELHVPGGEAALKTLSEAGAMVVSSEALNIVRIEAGKPIDGVDIDSDTIPLEARLDEAIDSAKGCYIGQEVIARATHRGGVKYHLVGLRFDAQLPAVGAELWSPVMGGEKAKGEVTSVAHSPTLNAMIGLGYVHIDLETPGTRVEARWASERVGAEVVALPHVSGHASRNL